MELILQILMLFIFINVLIKLSFWKWWQAVLFGAVCAAFIVVSQQFAISQSKAQLADYLANQTVLQDIAVLITVEAVLYIAFCFLSLLSERRDKSTWWIKALKWYPGLLVFPVLFFILTQVIYASPGVDFRITSFALAGITLVAVPGLSYAVKYVLPDSEQRLEVHFLVTLFVCVIGLITTVNGNVTYAASEQSLNIKAIAFSLMLFAIAFLVGMFVDRIKWVLFSKRKNLNKDIN